MSNVSLQFSYTEKNGLSVVIDTENLHMRSVQATDLDRYVDLCNNQDVINHCATEVPRTKEEIASCINKWVEGWRSYNPFSGMVVLKKDTKEFVGHISLAPSIEGPGISEVTGVSLPKYWKQGYALEAIRVIFKQYIPAIINQGFLLGGNPLVRVIAIARSGSPVFEPLLQSVGMVKYKDVTKQGERKAYYTIDVA